MSKQREASTCPHCGERVPAGRLACPECGSDANTGWQDQEEIDYTSVDIPDAWPPDDDTGRHGLPPWLWWTAVLALLAFVLVAILR